MRPPTPCSEPEPRPLSSGSPVMPVPVLQPPLRPQSELRLPFGKYDRQNATRERHILLAGMNRACTLWPPAAAPTVSATECRPAPVALAADRRATPPTASRSIGDAAAFTPWWDRVALGIHSGLVPSPFCLATLAPFFDGFGGRPVELKLKRLTTGRSAPFRCSCRVRWLRMSAFIAGA